MEYWITHVIGGQFEDEVTPRQIGASQPYQVGKPYFMFDTFGKLREVQCIDWFQPANNPTYTIFLFQAA